MSELITSKQSLHIGAEVAGILHELGADRVESQTVIERPDHPVWGKIREIITACLVKVEEVKKTILEWTSDLIIPAQPRFVVVEKFTKDNPDVKFWDFGGNFRAWHMPLIEDEVGETEISIHKLRIPANHGEMTPELGERRLVTASQLYWMLSQQPRGEKPNGKNRRLHTDGRAILLRIPDKDGIERAVSVYWIEGYGWYVNASELEYQYRWGAGYRVVSCK